MTNSRLAKGLALLLGVAGCASGGGRSAGGPARCHKVDARHARDAEEAGLSAAEQPPRLLNVRHVDAGWRIRSVRCRSAPWRGR